MSEVADGVTHAIFKKPWKMCVRDLLTLQIPNTYLCHVVQTNKLSEKFILTKYLHLHENENTPRKNC